MGNIFIEFRESQQYVKKQPYHILKALSKKMMSIKISETNISGTYWYETDYDNGFGSHGYEERISCLTGFYTFKPLLVLESLKKKKLLDKSKYGKCIWKKYEL